MNQAILDLLKENLPRAEIAKKVGCSLSYICLIAKKHGLSDPKTSLIPWAEIQAYYDEGHSNYECIKHFHFSRASWYSAIAKGKIVPREKIAPPISIWLTSNCNKSRGFIKRECLKAGLLPNKCHICNNPPEWQGKPLVLVLDHINGVSDDYRLENLRLLCPSCNSQTPTFAGRNIVLNKQKKP